MDEKAKERSHPQDEEARWKTRPASPHEDNRQEAQAQTQRSLQPLDSVLEGLRTMSPPPVALEKAINSSLDSQPGTSATSTTSSLSRSSTLTSIATTQSQDTDITLFSRNSTSSDETLSPSRALTLPVIGTFRGDRKSRPKRANLSLLEAPESFFEQNSLFSYGGIVPVPFSQFRPGRINRYLSWPDLQREEIPTHNNQAPLPRHLTFPIEGSREPSKPDSTAPSMLDGREGTTVPDSSDMGDHRPKDVAIPVTEKHYNVFRQEMIPNEAEFGNLQTQTDMYLRERFTSDHWMMDSLDSKGADLHRGFASYHSTHIRSQRGKRALNDLKEAIIEAARYQDAEEEQLSRQDSTVVNLGAAINPEAPDSIELQKEVDDNQESLQSSPARGKKPYRRNAREPCSPSSDNTSSSHEDSGAESEDSDDSAYDTLVESITNVVLESSVVGNVEERGVPVELYIHSFLEQILSHSKSAAETQVFSLPIRNVPIQNNDTPRNVGEPNMRIGGQDGNGGRGGGNKRKNEGPGGHDRYGDGGDDGDFGDNSEEDRSSRKQVKKLKTGKKGHGLSCPFRKRNPTRFNVRNHGNCALHSFADFALLKRHIKTFHQRNKSFSCPRCQDTFADQAALNIHLTQRQSCPLLSPTGDEDPEDGITDAVIQALKVRTKDDNVREWSMLWKLLFPTDDIHKIPPPDFEPLVEWDEVRDHCYREDSLHKFVSNIRDDEPVTEHGFRYVVEILQQCRETRFDKHSKGRPYQGERRLERDQRFVNTVKAALTARQCASQAQQNQPVVPSEPLQEVTSNPSLYDLDDSMLFGIDESFLDSQFSGPYPGNPAYGTHTNLGFDGGSHIPAPIAPYTSSEDASRMAPQHTSMNVPYEATQNGRPCPTLGRSRNRSSAQYSSGLSSQPSRDSGDLRTLETHETQDTQFTQYTQEHDAALLPHTNNGRPGDHHGACNCSTSPGGIPISQHSCSGIPSQDPSDLNFVGARPLECPDGSNSDEDLGPVPNMQSSFGAQR